MTRDEKQALVDIIAHAIATGGDLAQLREKHGVQYDAWQRIVRSVKNGKAAPSHAAADMPENVVRFAKQKKPRKPQPSKDSRAKVGELITAKDRAMASGSLSRRNIDEPIHFMAHVHHVLANCDEIEAAARDEDGNLKGREGPLLLNEAVKRRVSALTMMVSAQDKRWVGHRMDLRQKAIMAAIEEADPETKAKIARNFREIDRVMGITFGG